MSDFSLSGFISNQTNQDFARGYVFYAMFEGVSFIDNSRRFLVKSSSLPASQNTPVEANWQGNVYKLATTNEYSDFTIDFNMDVNDALRTEFLTWNDKIHQVKDNVHGIPMEYMQNVKLEHLSHNTGDPIMTYTLWKAFPTNIGELSLDYSAKDIATFSVTFAYQWHEWE